MIRILLADDHRLVRKVLKDLFSLFDDIAVTGEAATGDEVLQRLADDKFDLVLLDVTMPGISGAELISRIREDVSSPPILVLTMHNEPQIARRKMAAGANGFLTKDCTIGVLQEAIHKVASGGRYMQDAMGLG